jgi:hypothetical protein
MFKHIKKGYKGEKDSEDAERIAAATVNKQLGEDEGEKKASGDKIPKGKLAKLNPDIVKGDKPSMKPGEKPSLLKKEAGAISEYDESEELKLIRGLNLITQKLLGMHKGLDIDKHEKEDHGDHIDENGPQYKVRDGRSYVEQTGKVNRAREIQEDPVINEDEGQYKVRDGRSYTEQTGKVNRAREIQKDPTINEDEGQYKVRDGKSQVEQPGKVNRAREIQKDPKVNEAAHKVQARSFKTIKDVDQDPKNPADPEVPMSEALTEAKKLLAKIKAARRK